MQYFYKQQENNQYTTILDCHDRDEQNTFTEKGDIVNRTPGWEMRTKRSGGRPNKTWVRTIRQEVDMECWSG